MTFQNHWARWCCPAKGIDDWVPASQIQIDPSDLGFRQAVTVVERLRTYRGRPFSVGLHHRRLLGSLRLLQLENAFRIDAWRSNIAEILQRNPEFCHEDRDVGITFWLTPDSWALQLNPIDHQAIALRQRHGQLVVMTDVRQPPGDSWSRQAKIRCRLHYFLADRQAGVYGRDAVGVLSDDDGGITETSIANIALIQRGHILSPPSQSVLSGITQRWAMRLARRQQIDWTQTRITSNNFMEADEIMLMGTDGGIWP
ncbi:MAG: aminotransferase class IV, partial [Planctomycetota bacterium]